MMTRVSFIEGCVFLWLMRMCLSGVEGLPELTELFLLDLILDVLHVFPQFDLQLSQF